MTNEEIKEMEKIIENAEKESALLAAKKLMEIHEKWKEKHPRPKRKKDDEANDNI